MTDYIRLDSTAIIVYCIGRYDTDYIRLDSGVIIVYCIGRYDRLH